MTLDNNPVRINKLIQIGLSVATDITETTISKAESCSVERRNGRDSTELVINLEQINLIELKMVVHNTSSIGKRKNTSAVSLKVSVLSVLFVGD